MTPSRGSSPDAWGRRSRPTPIVPGRGAAGALAVVGLLLAATPVVWPTRALVLTTAEVGEFHRVLRIERWSWGRELSVAGNGATFDAASGPANLVALVALCVVLPLAMAGVVAWLIVPGRTGEVLGAAGMAAGLATVVQSWAQRVGGSDASGALLPGLTSQTLAAGHLESAGGLLLGVALLLALRPNLRAAFARAADRARRAVADAVERDRAVERRREAEHDSARQASRRGRGPAAPRESAGEDPSRRPYD